MKNIRSLIAGRTIWIFLALLFVIADYCVSFYIIGNFFESKYLGFVIFIFIFFGVSRLRMPKKYKHLLFQKNS